MTNYSLTRRYWMSLLCLTFSAGSRASMSVRYGYSLWSRYWATLLGSPPRPGAANSTQANGTSASLVIPDVPRKRMKDKEGPRRCCCGGAMYYSGGYSNLYGLSRQPTRPSRSESIAAFRCRPGASSTSG